MTRKGLYKWIKFKLPINIDIKNLEEQGIKINQNELICYNPKDDDKKTVFVILEKYNFKNIILKFPNIDVELNDFAKFGVEMEGYGNFLQDLACDISKEIEKKTNDNNQKPLKFQNIRLRFRLTKEEIVAKEIPEVNNFDVALDGLNVPLMADCICEILKSNNITKVKLEAIDKELELKDPASDLQFIGKKMQEQGHIIQNLAQKISQKMDENSSSHDIGFNH